MGIERVYNLITLSSTAHRYWSRGAFALKPISISDDNTTLKIQFFWQKKQNTQAAMNLLTPPFSTEDLDQNEGALDSNVPKLLDFGFIMLFNYRAKHCIKSGDFFELQTNDAIATPLPSFKLLEMQWFLQRVAGMAGTADLYDDEDWPEESDEEIPDLGLDEDEDEFY